MAGLGSRFSKEGYLLPKPLIPVSGKPMITQVINRLPPADKWIFILLEEHIEKYKIDKHILSIIPEGIIIVDPDPKGQAATAMLALTQVDDNEELFFSACDNGFLYNETKFNKLRADDSIDSIVWTFTQDELLNAKPEAWGWIKLEEDNETIADMSIKVPVSDNPFYDHAVVATFWFRRAGDFKAAYAKMFEEDHRVNGEFYIDSMPIFMRKIGKKSVIFPVDLYVSWGKPADLHLYNLREYEYKTKQGKGYSDQNWNKFFNS